MRIACPFCGERGHEEFSYLGDAAVRRPEAQDAASGTSNLNEAAFNYVYLRANPSGRHRELWQHVHGCRAWLVVTRDTRTHAVEAVTLAQQTALRERGQT